MDLKRFLPLNKVVSYLNKISDIVTIERYFNSSNSFFWYGNFKNKSIFFKLMDKLKHNKMMPVYLEYWKKLNLCKIIKHMKISEKYYLVIYEDYKTWYNGSHNWIEFLNDPLIDPGIKVATFKNTYLRLFYLAKNSLKYGTVTTYPNKVFFEDRFWAKRLYKYYGLYYVALLHDVKNLLGDDSSILLKKLLFLSRTIIWKKEKTFSIVAHWDLHDLNYCFYPINDKAYDALFLDVDTVGRNPFLSDFVCYYRYLIYQSDSVIYKYNNEFYWGQPQVKKKERDSQINIYLEQYFYPILNIIGSKFAWRDEFLWRFIMRILWVYNVLSLNAIDRKKIYFILIDLFHWYENDKTLDKLPFNWIISDKYESF